MSEKEFIKCKNCGSYIDLKTGDVTSASGFNAEKITEMSETIVKLKTEIAELRQGKVERRKDEVETKKDRRKGDKTGGKEKPHYTVEDIL